MTLKNFDLNEQERIRSQKISELQVVSDEFYKDIIPKEMNATYLNDIYRKVFGVDVMEIYLDRNIFETKSIIISDFSTNQFFWAQTEEEDLLDRYRKVYEKINHLAETTCTKLADKNAKWCIAQFQGEWYRAFIDKALDNEKFQVFFFDYGTFSIIEQENTRTLEDDDVWIIPPLAIPCAIKDIKPEQINKFRDLQYQTFKVRSFKMIEKVIGGTYEIFFKMCRNS